MRILILGATAVRGHHLRRSPEKLPEDLSSNESLVIIKGTLTDADAPKGPSKASDVVLSALGPWPTTPRDPPRQGI
ncbi:hypothetical protein D9611_005827 [Ephemerocybe angulata]|uniref:Uncharacterized protein n=1 Tax=Ephemerocybe angulata TaxID=980116 RepID=A0A8H5F4B5_9AGAR|nr:hypothetical protein D9611_005827 [Tulosesus angulatus]